MKIIKLYLILFTVSSFLLACSQAVNAKVYMASGLAVETPIKWKFGDDKNLNQQQVLTFFTGEFSYITLRTYPEETTSKRRYKDINAENYIERYFLPRITFNGNKDTYKIKTDQIFRSPFTGIKIQIKYNLLDLDDIEAEVYLLTLDNAKIIVTIYTEKKDLPNVAYAIEDFLTSIKYVGSDKAIN